jgi:phosphoglycolate phosphatase-like HAD superfamily hydrolase
VIATLRRIAGATRATGWLGIDGYFQHVLTPDRGVHSGAKLPMLQPLGRNGGTMVIGDSEADVVLAQGLDAELVCVTNGVRDESFLRAAGATLLLAEVAELPKVLG